jgi:hypothetical protein
MPIVIDPPVSPPLSPAPEDGSELWEVLYEALGWHKSQDAENGYPWRKVCEAWCAGLQRVYDVVRERDDQAGWDQAGWAILLDPDNCPADSLPYLAQYVGAVLTPNMSEEQMRDEIREPTGWARGRLPSITLITKRELTGTQWVRIRPRTPGPGEIYIRVLASECPNPSRVEDELLEHGIPAWELLDFEALEGVTVADVAASSEWTTVADLAEAFATVDDLAHMLPDEL